jgi:hypothetical protein
MVMDATMWTIIGTGIGVVSIIYTFLRNLKIDLKTELSEIKFEIREMNTKMADVDKRLYAVETVFI